MSNRREKTPVDLGLADHTFAVSFYPPIREQTLMCCSEESLEMLEIWFTLECEREMLADAEEETFSEAA
jgi:hypothetical protein